MERLHPPHSLYPFASCKTTQVGKAWPWGRNLQVRVWAQLWLWQKPWTPQGPQPHLKIPKDQWEERRDSGIPSSLPRTAVLRLWHVWESPKELVNTKPTGSIPRNVSTGLEGWESASLRATLEVQGVHFARGQLHRLDCTVTSRAPTPQTLTESVWCRTRVLGCVQLPKVVFNVQLSLRPCALNTC